MSKHRPDTSARWRDYRRLWLPELMVLLVLAVTLTPVFWFSDLDIRAADLFYHPENPQDPWFEEHDPLWRFCYQTSPLLAALLGFGSLLVLAASHVSRRFADYRAHALFVLLVVIVGPGLLVNGLFKEHWDRARPRQIVEFGELQFYTPPLKIGSYDEGKSFPAGHSSVAFSLVFLWFLWRRRNLALAITALLGTLVVGSIYGAGRMAAGAHFLSDVLWSALITAATSLVLYYFVLNIPAREDRGAAAWPPRHPRIMMSVYAALAVTLLVGVLVLTPFRHNWTDIHSTPLQRLTLNVDAATVALRLTPSSSYAARIKGRARGFGFPGNSLVIDNDAAGSGTYSIAHRGVFTEIDSRLFLRINPTKISALDLRVGRGDVQVRNAYLRDSLQLTITAPAGQVTWLD